MRPKIGVRLLCLVLCLAVLLPCVTHMLRLREKPSTSSKVLDAYPRGTKVMILKKGSAWTKVQVHGKTGYMQTDKLAYAKYKTAAEKEVIFSPSSSAKKKVTSGETAYIKKGVRLNLRSSASSSGDIIGSYRSGTKVTVITKGRTWSLVEIRGLQGYMYTEYLSAEKE